MGGGDKVKDTVTTFKLVFAAIGGYIGWFLGGYDGFYTPWLFL